MMEVSQDEFWDVIGNRDVVSSIIGSYPYTSEFHMRGNRYNIVGKIVGFLPEGKALTEKKYLLP